METETVVTNILEAEEAKSLEVTVNNDNPKADEVTSKNTAVDDTAKVAERVNDEDKAMIICIHLEQQN